MIIEIKDNNNIRSGQYDLIFESLLIICIPIVNVYF